MKLSIAIAAGRNLAIFLLYIVFKFGSCLGKFGKESFFFCLNFLFRGGGLQFFTVAGDCRFLFQKLNFCRKFCTGFTGATSSSTTNSSNSDIFLSSSLFLFLGVVFSIVDCTSSSTIVNISNSWTIFKLGFATGGGRVCYCSGICRFFSGDGGGNLKM